MNTIYLNSLYNLIFQRNPFCLIGIEFYKNCRSLVNIRRNRGRAEKRLIVLNNRLQKVKAYVDAPAPQRQTTFDVSR
jgi:hypothetical protein